MLFNSFIFFIFLGIVLPVFYLLPSKKSKNIFLLIASYFFYGYWDWRFCSLLAISTIADFTIGKYLYITTKEKSRKLLLILSLLINLGILGFFKYFNFFTESFKTIFNAVGFNADFLHLNIILPVGISFYTFQTLSYTLDIFRKRLKPTKNFIDFALFVSFFPQLVAGPIERAKNLLPQLANKLRPSKQQMKEGVVLIVFGLFRKVMIGDTAGRYVDHIFGNPELYMSFELISALILFSIQIYADFSGYSHIARGTAKLLGVELMKNFEQPYLSRNITEFWRRWHISLSSWLKDYLYISLGGNRKGKHRMYLNLMVTMLLGGLWHGASWNFVIWGGLHGLFLAIHKLYISNRKIDSSNIKLSDTKHWFSLGFKILLTNILVLITWLFFRISDMETLSVYIYGVFNWQGSDYTLRFILIILTYSLVTFLFDFCEYFSGKHTYLLNLKNKYVVVTTLIVMFVITLVYLAQSEPLPFVYFQF